jgi:hypothetical protein
MIPPAEILTPHRSLQLVIEKATLLTHVIIKPANLYLQNHSNVVADGDF